MTAPATCGTSAPPIQGAWDLGPPVIDAAQLFAAGNTAAPPAEVAAAIAGAASTWGFFQLTNHGLDAEALARLTRAMHAFFDLDLEVKLQVGGCGTCPGVVLCEVCWHKRLCLHPSAVPAQLSVLITCCAGQTERRQRHGIRTRWWVCSGPQDPACRPHSRCPARAGLLGALSPSSSVRVQS